MNDDQPKGAPYRLIEGQGPFVRRRIVTFRRLEPGDVRTEDALPVPESPFLEARLFDIEVPAATHERMKRLAEAKSRALDIPHSMLLEYQPAGMMIAAAGGMAIGVMLDYLRPERVFFGAAGWIGALGLVTAFLTKRRRLSAEAAAKARWTLAEERAEYEALARELAARWQEFVQKLRKETGFYVDIRVAEGSRDPMRLASIDPRPLENGGFDPEDFLPTEGGGVRYEAVHAAGIVGTRLMPGASETSE